MGTKKMPQEVLTMLQKIQENGLLSWLGVIFVSAWAGAVRYFSRLDGRKLVWSELFIEIFTSGFVGLMAGLMCSFYEIPLSMTYVVIGVSAHYGTRSLYVIGEILKKKFELYRAVSEEIAQEEHRDAIYKRRK